MEEHLPLEADGYSCTTDDLLNVLLGVAANPGTIEAVCADLVGAPDADTIRAYFNEQLRVEDWPDLAERLNAALASEIPERVRRRAREVAIDRHDRPYYGKQPQADGWWMRGRAKDGTTRFYRVATAYGIEKNVRLTLAIRFVVPGDDTLTILDDLLNRLKTQGIRIERLFLDCGFDSIAVMEYLTGRQQPALTPALASGASVAGTIRGKTGGTRALCPGRCSYRTQHPFHGTGATAFTAELAVCRVFTTAKRTGRRKREADWMIFILIQLDWTPRQVRRQYRRRFGIETSYRCAGQVRGWTTSPNPTYRFLLIALSFVLLNVWVHLRWLFTQVRRRGGRWLNTKLLQLNRLVKFIGRALERCYGCQHVIFAPTAPRL